MVWGIAILFVLFCAYTLKSKLEIKYFFKDGQDELCILLRGPANLVLYRKEMAPLAELLPYLGQSTLVGESGSRDILTGLNQLRDKARLYKPLSYFLSHSKLKESNLDVAMGAGDVAQTGFCLGLIWFLIGSLQSLVQNKLCTDASSFCTNITPLWQECSMGIEFNCIVSIRFVHVIIAHTAARKEVRNFG